MNKTKTGHSTDEEQGIYYGPTFFVTGMIILILGIITLIAISKIF